MPSSFQFVPNPVGIARMMSPEGDVGRAVERVTDQVANVARALAPVDTGRLRASIRTRIDTEPGKIVGHVYTDVRSDEGFHYFWPVHEGSGIYGPTGSVIRPRTARALRFQAGGQTVFARYVRGQRAQPFLWEALQRTSPWPVTRT